ncbi:hypothetical protein [Jannaschia ovalis]|uniref:Uncharacterized protein n=1 Tax=Jannaschia ovalis TaxID=3038773 RepID=A0ABY8LB51_9RHOB|nr:hypothetical protein [Jannaschia sp. GRR-S6-38]WGH78563.1 hypothetical protein P8627_16340 [Jannaschia sp. GRR-S6-38]
MIELLFAIAVVSLAAGGIGLGLVFGRAPVRSSCGAADRLPDARCADCPLRRRAARGTPP